MLNKKGVIDIIFYTWILTSILIVKEHFIIAAFLVMPLIIICIVNIKKNNNERRKIIIEIITSLLLCFLAVHIDSTFNLNGLLRISVILPMGIYGYFRHKKLSELAGTIQK